MQRMYDMYQSELAVIVVGPVELETLKAHLPEFALFQTIVRTLVGESTMHDAQPSASEKIDISSMLILSPMVHYVLDGCVHFILIFCSFHRTYLYCHPQKQKQNLARTFQATEGGYCKVIYIYNSRNVRKYCT